MSNEISLKFGSLTFDSVTTITDIRLRHRKNPKLINIPKTDGVIAETAKLREMVIAIEGDIYGADYDTKRTNLDTLKAAFNNGMQKFTMDDDRYVMAQLDNLDADEILLRNLSHWSASLIAHYPFWLAEAATEVEKTEGVDMTSGVGFTVNNPGNAPARAKIEFTAPGGGIADNIQLENTTLSQLMKYRGTLAAADVLEIDNRYDTDAFQVLNDGVDDISNFEGDFITLAPGNNTIEFTGQAGTVLKITFRATYY